jgi:hypothetical protein
VFNSVFKKQSKVNQKSKSKLNSLNFEIDNQKTQNSKTIKRVIMSSVSEIEEHKEENKVEIESEPVYTDVASKKQKKKNKTQLKQERDEKVKIEFKYTHVDPVNPNLKSSKVDELPALVKIDEPCLNFFRQDQICKYGDKCRYSHSDFTVNCCEKDCKFRVAFNPKYHMKIQRCAEHASMIKERKKKERLSKIPCQWYPSCRYGDNCIYQHGPDNDIWGSIN